MEAEVYFLRVEHLEINLFTMYGLMHIDINTPHWPSNKVEALEVKKLPSRETPPKLVICLFSSCHKEGGTS